jgi:nucleolar protein 58
MTILLERNSYAVKPHMVTNRIIEMAYALYECDLCENKHAKSLQDVVDLIKEVSDIDFNDWDSLKHVFAVKIILYPKETYDSKMFLDDELSKLSALAPSLEGKFYENTCLEIYKDIVLARGIRNKAQRLLKSLVKEARESCTGEGEQADLPEKTKRQCVDEPERV